jgi:predicted nucleic acid-binding protein
MSEPRSLVLDANVLIRAALGPNARGIIERHADSARFFVPARCVAEAHEHLPAIVKKRNLDVHVVMGALDAVVTLVHVIDAPMYAETMTEARARLEMRDPDDADALALALILQCPIWTEDQDFFGTGVATWTTRQVERYLA